MSKLAESTKLTPAQVLLETYEGKAEELAQELASVDSWLTVLCSKYHILPMKSIENKIIEIDKRLERAAFDEDENEKLLTEVTNLRNSLTEAKNEVERVTTELQYARVYDKYQRLIETAVNAADISTTDTQAAKAAINIILDYLLHDADQANLDLEIQCIANQV